jgi:transposase
LHIPEQPIVGRKRADDRQTINGILYVLITGCSWHDMPLDDMLHIKQLGAGSNGIIRFLEQDPCCRSRTSLRNREKPSIGRPTRFDNESYIKR